MESLSTPDEMAAYLSQLGRDHRKYRVEPEMYEAVGAALLATLRAFARDAFTSEAEEAWTQVYLAGSSLMIKAAEEDAARSPASWTAEVVKVDHRGGQHRRADHRTGSAAAVHGGPAPHRADTALAAGLAAVLDRVHATRRRPHDAAREGGSWRLGEQRAGALHRRPALSWCWGRRWAR